MVISILTLFPEMFQGPFDYSILKKAKEKGLVEIEFINIRNFGIGKHQVVDDTIYGGGVGMVMRVDVVHEAITFAKRTYAERYTQKSKEVVALLSARGTPYNQSIAKEYSQLDHLILICGHYEGIDDRIKKYIDQEISIGDFVVTGGELPALLIVDSVVRLLPGVLKEGATENESFSLTHDSNEAMKTLEYPQFTRPKEYDGESVPEVLLSGNHKRIDAWRRKEALELTRISRPDLLKKTLNPKP